MEKEGEEVGELAAAASASFEQFCEVTERIISRVKQCTII